MRDLGSTLASFLAAALAVAVPACGNGVQNKPATDGGRTTDSKGYVPPEAFTPTSPPPLLHVPDNGGPILTSPHIVIASYMGDPNASYMQGFLQWFPTSSYFTATLAEYGVGAGTYDGAITIAKSISGTVSESTVSSDLDNAIAGSGITPTSQTIFIVLTPPGVTVTGGTGTSCQDYLGFHFITGAGHIYALIPDCPGAIGTLTDGQVQTIATSHEISEAATDPHINAYQIFGEVFGGEIGDMCADEWVTEWSPTGSGYWVQREWSNKAAAAGMDPCAPPNPPYYGVGPSSGGDQISVVAGGTMTLDVVAWAEQPISSAIGVYVQTESNAIKVTPSPMMLAPGQHATLTIDATGASPGCNRCGFELYGIIPSYINFSEWPIQVTVN